MDDEEEVFCWPDVRILVLLTPSRGIYDTNALHYRRRICSCQSIFLTLTKNTTLHQKCPIWSSRCCVTRDPGSRAERPLVRARRSDGMLMCVDNMVNAFADGHLYYCCRGKSASKFCDGFVWHFHSSLSMKRNMAAVWTSIYMLALLFACSSKSTIGRTRSLWHTQEIPREDSSNSHETNCLMK